MRIRILIAFACLLAGLSACLMADGGYAARVIRHQDASTDDYLWRQQSEVLPGPSPVRMPEAFASVLTRSTFEAANGQTLEDWLITTRAFGFVVVKDGAIVFEQYGEGGARDEPQAAFSLSKTFLALMLARASRDGTLASLDAPLESLVPELGARDAALSGITLRDLIDMRSGIGFSEVTRFPWINQDAPSVYYASDLARTVLQRPASAAPRGTFQYNDYAPNLTGLALQRASGKRLAEGSLQSLWQAMGAAYPARWQEDQKGFAYHESGLVLTARDLARFGALWLSDPEDVIPDDFARDVITPDARSVATSFGGTRIGYRGGWWILAAPDGSEDLVGMGRHGQILLVSPSKGVVMARLGREGGPETNIALALKMQRAAHGL
jgi:CubicO group peptidase (beta-lactamase class C family)